MNILICDDMPDAARELNDLLLGSGFNISTAIFHSAYDALDYVHSGAAVDLCFLDIIMPDMSGVELAQQLRQDGYAGRIIFLSTSNEYAHESYFVEAFDYLIKPPESESVKSVLRKLESARQNADTKDIMIKSAGIVKSVLLRDISHAEVINHKVYFRLKDDSLVCVYATFGEIAAELLRDPRFIQCHRSYIINMDDVSEIVERDIFMRTGARIPITRSYYGAKSAYYKWKFGGRG